MSKSKDLEMLKNLYLQIKNLNTPNYSQNVDLETWIENLIELDAYYAGWALTVAEGGKISTHDLYDMDKFKKKLASIQVDNDEDEMILQECRAYLKIIDQIDHLLRKLSYM